MAAGEVYGIAAAFLDAAGVLNLFTHALGHGIGLQTHEAPSLNATSESILRPGMVLTVEPGLYRRGSYGIRWENMVLVTEDGARVL
jgi:Xaa-Pro aminopeptidase